MAATICRDEAMRIGGELALMMLHRPGWGWALSWPGQGAFHAALTTPEVQQVGEPGLIFGGEGETPSKALEAALMSSAHWSAHGVRPEAVR